MLKNLVFIFIAIALCAIPHFAQNSNSSTTKVRPRTTDTKAVPAQTPKPPVTAKPATKSRGQTGTSSAAARAQPSASGSVRAAFDALLEGIRHANVNAVTSTYWNSPGLVLYNNNGTVTKGWEQMRKNRESSYRDLKDVKLDVRDVNIKMLGRDGAVVTCLWTQSQSYKGTPETASGRMTLVFQRMGKDWKAVHLHTSPDAPNPSRVLPSEQPSSPGPSPTPK